MPGVKDWVKQRITNFSQITQKTMVTVTETISSLSQSLVSLVPTPIRSLTSNTVDQLTAVFGDIFNLAALKKIYRSSHTSKAFFASASTNIVFNAIPAFLTIRLYEAAYPDEDSSTEYVQLYQAMTFITFYLMIRRWIRMNFIDNVAYAFVIAKTVQEENSINNDDANSCFFSNDNIQSILADCFYGVEFYTTRTLTFSLSLLSQITETLLLSNYAYYITIMAKLIESYNLGRYFYNNNLSINKKNAEQRHAIITGNKVSLMLCGFILLLLSEKTAALFDIPPNEKATFFYKNVFYSFENTFISTAFFNVYFQLFTALSYLTKTTLPNNDGGVDVLYLTHLASNKILNKIFERIEFHFRHDDFVNNLKKQLKEIKNTIQYPSGQLFLHLFLDDLSSFDKAVRIPSIELFLNHYEKNIENIPEFIEKNVRASILAKILNYLPINYYGIRNLIQLFNGQPILDLKKGIEVINCEAINPFLEGIKKSIVARKKHLQEIEKIKAKQQKLKSDKEDAEEAKKIIKSLSKIKTESSFFTESKITIFVKPKNGKVDLMEYIMDDYIPDSDVKPSQRVSPQRVRQ